MPKEYDVFICHNSEDKPDVKNICVLLKERGFNPWLDEWELPPGKPWQRLLEEQISKISSAAVFVGKSGIGPWQQMEIEALLREFVKNGKPVIPVLLPSAPKNVELPMFLSGMTWVNYTEDSKDLSNLDQLIWGITGTRPYSTLQINNAKIQDINDQNFECNILSIVIQRCEVFISAGNEPLRNCGMISAEIVDDLIHRSTNNLPMWGGNRKWKTEAKAIGRQFYKELEKIDFFQEKVVAPQKDKTKQVLLRYGSDSRELGLPFELLHDGIDFWSLLYPTSRFILDLPPFYEKEIIKITHKVETLHLHDSQLLLMGANLPPMIPGVVKEVSSIADIWNKNESVEGQKPDIIFLVEENANYERLVDALVKASNNFYFHFAGHGVYDEENPEESGFFVWMDNNCSKIQKVILPEFLDIIRDNPPKLCFLSCCTSGQVGRNASHLEDFVGLVHSAIAGGSHNAITYRWPVQDSDAVDFASEFYQQLSTTQSIEIAMWKARRKQARSGRNNDTWASPILISQK